MGKFNVLLGKGKEVKIGEEVYEIKPLTAKHLGLFVGETNQADAMFELITVSLQQTDPSITKADIEEMPVNIFNEVAEVIMEVNGLNK